MQLLRAQPMTAGELSAQFEVSKPTMSAHFTVLREAGLVDTEKHGRQVLYRLKMSVLEEALLGFAHALGLEMTLEPTEATAEEIAPSKGKSS